MRNSFAYALLLAALLIAPSAALAASHQCLCDNGKKMRTTSDAEEACATACDLFGGGGTLIPEDTHDAENVEGAGNAEGEPAAEDAAPVRRRVVANPPAAAPTGTEDPRLRP